MKHSLYEQFKENLIQGYIAEPELVQSTLLQTLDILKTRLEQDEIPWPEFLRQVMNCTRENLLAFEEADRRGGAHTQH